jgi:50S ribosomal subunit-associated GTPase HflX
LDPPGTASGGLGFVGGPGETQIELDRRLIGERIARLKTELEEVKRTRHLHRAARKRVPFPVVALVGYTNAGRSTLFNRLPAPKSSRGYAVSPPWTDDAAGCA